MLRGRRVEYGRGGGARSVADDGSQVAVAVRCGAAGGPGR